MENVHQSAFGIEINKDKVNEAIKLCNEIIPIDSLCTIHTVDWEIEAINLKEQDVKEVAENYPIWGNSVPIFYLLLVILLEHLDLNIKKEK